MGRGSGIAVRCGADCRHGLDPVLLWLWCRLAVVVLIRPLAWELPYVVGVALKSKKKKKKKRYKPNWTMVSILAEYPKVAMLLLLQFLVRHTIFGCPIFSDAIYING